MKLLKSKNIKIGEIIRLHDVKFNHDRKCIVTYIDKDEIVLTYYDEEIKEMTCKVLTKEDLIFNDYELKLLS
ncbi:hypothetical protein KWY15_17650 [Clostridioides difficile]|uniref:hypothetical protein n=1 Tax=Clostridioides difficile TaxID=1496 RepID=UPI00038D6646|nr:hypothetical protein [Clostridioides difficile]HBR0068328.1 hypothetical protein [Klebsiella pneumoniae]HBR0840986.1 hypothetical protein [Klebsiella quasipneumoniae]EGT3663331.1 hypothetical protein [Clostridioides difficile]EGT3731080.1 hypothetical protein [Clostridioides difficile]EGT3772715.1 hypothetical protein [Clostridioides difficile]